MFEKYALLFNGEEITRDAEIAQAYRQIQHDPFYMNRHSDYAYTTFDMFYLANKQIVEIQ